MEKPWASQKKSHSKFKAVPADLEFKRQAIDFLIVFSNRWESFLDVQEGEKLSNCEVLTSYLQNMPASLLETTFAMNGRHFGAVVTRSFQEVSGKI